MRRMLTVRALFTAIPGLTGRAFSRESILGILLTAVVALNGCGTSSPERKNQFFTSGNRAADQRAMQRMARAEQLAGRGAGSGEKNSGEHGGAAKSEGKRTLYERLGGEQRLAALVDDFTARVLEDPRVSWSRQGVKHGGFFRPTTEEMWHPTSA